MGKLNFINCKKLFKYTSFDNKNDMTVTAMMDSHSTIPLQVICMVDLKAGGSVVEYLLQDCRIGVLWVSNPIYRFRINNLGQYVVKY